MKIDTNSTKGETRKGLRAIWRHLQPFKSNLIIMIVLGVISAAANGSIPYVTGRFFDALINVSKHEGTLLWGSLPLWTFLLAIWVLVQLIANNIDWINDRIRRRVGLNLQLNIQTDGFIHMFKLPVAYHKNAHTNGELQKISSASWRIQSIFDNFVQIAPQFLSIIIGITLAASINLMLAGVLLGGVVLYVTLLIYILKPIARIDSLAHRVWNEGWNDAAAAVQQIESVKQAAAEDYEVKKTRESLLGKAFDLWIKIEKTWNNVSFFQRTLVFLTQLLIFILSVNLISNGTITVGQLITLNGYSLMFFGPFVALGSSWQVVQNGIISAAHSEEIFEEKREIYVPKNAVKPKYITGDITFDHVYFQYGPDQPEILSDININIQAGEIVAVVGESGVGKSTAISLISGYYFSSKGKVLIDGVDTRRLNLVNLRQHIAVVPQEVALFNDSVKVNIQYGTFDATDTDIIRVAKDAHIDEFIESLPDKYETLVGERGIKLSVGQKQRVAIARAMLRNPSILILDEPTSALDAKTEKIVTEALEKLMHGRTTFIIAHRLSTVRRANKILVFQKGQIVESGPHKELMKIENGVYRMLYEYQVGLH